MNPQSRDLISAMDMAADEFKSGESRQLPAAGSSGEPQRRSLADVSDITMTPTRIAMPAKINQSLRHPDHIGKYRVEEYLGGGMSRVYRAKDPLLGKTVAVKVLREDSSYDQVQRDRFLNEARMAANMEHPNIVSVYDFGEDHGRPFMVMEFLKGESLCTIIREKRTGDLKFKLRIALQIARALEHIHAQRIFHRDIKPENVNIDAAGAVKLMDFGIAKMEDLAITRPGFMIGTPCYMAPEQVQGKEATELVDIYAFGIVLFELLTGSRPITGESVEQVLYRIIHDAIDFKPLHDAAVPQSLIALIAACTSKDPLRRPHNVTTIRMELEREVEAVEPRTKQTGPSTADFTSSNRWLLAGALLVLAVVSLFAASLYRHRLSATHARASAEALAALPSLLQTASGEMVLVPEGDFLSGVSKDREILPAYYVDRTEVTNALYGKFCAETRKQTPAGFAGAPSDFPVVNITIDDARQFARWAGKRLPTRKEWEKAARGADGREYPWGNDANSALANVSSGSLAPVAAFPSGDSPWRVRQMVGNAWEFVDELSTPSARAVINFAKLLKPPPAASESWYLIMGGSYDESLLPGAAYDAAFVPARFRSPSIGFRCVKDAK